MVNIFFMWSIKKKTSYENRRHSERSCPQKSPHSARRFLHKCTRFERKSSFRETSEVFVMIMNDLMTQASSSHVDVECGVVN